MDYFRSKPARVLNFLDFVRLTRENFFAHGVGNPPEHVLGEIGGDVRPFGQGQLQIIVILCPLDDGLHAVAGKLGAVVDGERA